MVSHVCAVGLQHPLANVPGRKKRHASSAANDTPQVPATAAKRKSVGSSSAADTVSSPDASIDLAEVLHSTASLLKTRFPVLVTDAALRKHS